MADRKTTKKEQKKELLDLQIALIQPDEDQPRKHFDPDALAELSNSIKSRGVLQPILVRKGEGESYILVAGERRFRAAKDAGLKTIPAILTDDNPAEVALIENLLREDLTPMEEAEAMQKMMDKHGYTQEKLGNVVGKAPSTISEILSLNKLPDKIKADSRENPKIPRRVLVEIAKKKSSKEMLALYRSFQKRGLTSDEVRVKGRGKREPTAKQTIYLLTGLKNRLTSVDIAGWEASVKEEFKKELEGLKSIIEARLERLEA